MKCEHGVAASTAVVELASRCLQMLPDGSSSPPDASRCPRYVSQNLRVGEISDPVRLIGAIVRMQSSSCLLTQVAFSMSVRTALHFLVDVFLSGAL